MDKNIEEVEFTIFDTETTGLEPQAGDRVVEIAGIRVRGQEKIAAFQSLVNPKRPISSAAFQVNRISQEMLEGAPSMESVMPEFLKFVEGSCLCSYNAGFDLGFLNNELKLMGKSGLTNIYVIDILKMARRLMPASERHALWFVAQSLGLGADQAHRAFADVELTWKVFTKFKIMLKAKGIEDFTHFLNLFEINKRFLDNLNAQKNVEIQEAISLGVKLKIKYLSSQGAEVSEREVIPKELRQENGRSYLVGYCCLRKEERTFRVDGILHLEVV